PSGENKKMNKTESTFEQRTFEQRTFEQQIEPSNTELVTRIHNGDKDMERLFCTRFQPVVMSVLTSLSGDPDRSQDLSQDVLLTVIIRLRGRGIDQPENLRQFVMQTARYTFLGSLRRSDNKLVLLEHYDDHLVPTHTDADGIEQKEQRQALDQLLSQLNIERDREVLIRYYLHDEPKTLICDALTLSQVHFDRVISRARGRLRSLAATSGRLSLAS
ncbi:MAG: sigma-70 family RNA polymerase sigma factor, partial [Pseudomonadota bacterium]